MRKNKHILGLVLAVTVACLSFVAPVAAATNTTGKPATTEAPVSVQTVAQAYGTTKPLQQGLIVQLDEKNKANVTTATYKKSKNMFGVTIAAGNSAVSVSSAAAGEQVYVVTSGRYTVLVSNQNGPVSTGDIVSISAIDGIGMKADTVEEFVLGRAVTSFDGKKDVISTTNLKDSTGKQIKAAIGTVTVDIAITKNPLQTSGQNGVPDFIQKMAVGIVGKPISSPQLYASIVILVVGIGVVAALLYGGIQSGMTAIGRNPLAKKSILRNMVQVIVAGLMIFIGCLIAVYLVLKI